MFIMPPHLTRHLSTTPDTLSFFLFARPIYKLALFSSHIFQTLALYIPFLSQWRYLYSESFSSCPKA